MGDEPRRTHDEAQSQEEQGLEPGRHDAFVVDASWHEIDAASVLELEITLTRGEMKGHVITARFRHATTAFASAAAAFDLENVAAGDMGAAVHMIGLPCTLIVATDDHGRLGLAVARA